MAVGGDDLVHFGGEGGDFLAEFLGEFRELGVLVHELQQLGRLLGGEGELPGVLSGKFLAVLSIGLCVDFIPVGLASLGEEDERGGVGGLEAEGEVQENERVKIKADESRDVGSNPGGDDDGLSDEEHRCPEEARESFRLQSKPIVAEDGREVDVGQVETKMVGVTTVGDGDVDAVGIRGGHSFG